MLKSKHFPVIDRMIKKYIVKHPEISRYFPENCSQFEKIIWHRYKQHLPGAATLNDEGLYQKRWIITSKLVNEVTLREAKQTSIVLFHTPTNFFIEYLRVDVEKPFRRITVIDGRKDSKDFVEELPEDKIDRRVYPRFRKDENIKHI